MKKIFLSLLIIPVAGIGRFNRMHLLPTDKPVEIRTGEWPLLLQRSIEQSDTTYSLQFRDVQVLSGVVMDTLAFTNTAQLKYFEKALTTLKTGHTGDIARFKDYSITRADKKYEGVWYILKIKWGLTDFKQAEADLMVKTIRGLKF
ncbi:MAG: hypothetical protein ABIQ88_05100 [Chitinophagaceae bacterium]